MISGFMGGEVKEPSYYDVVKGDTGHIETVEVTYDPAKITFEQLAKTFFDKPIRYKFYLLFLFTLATRGDIKNHCSDENSTTNDILIGNPDTHQVHTTG